jgi:hypothetical protein
MLRSDVSNVGYTDVSSRHVTVGIKMVQEQKRASHNQFFLS